ncbi:unnamed protein product [Periconia digitata]|uniref:Uncharacterized protein n=1 Tax=Periconia digitata TaxID=1303443 RepID=A0A9W4UKR0_9PLEO|nr:unnamed protein product [Periconia digitata]
MSPGVPETEAERIPLPFSFCDCCCWCCTQRFLGPRCGIDIGIFSVSVVPGFVGREGGKEDGLESKRMRDRQRDAERI